VDVDQLFVFRMIRLESRSAAESRYLFGSRFRMQNVLRRQHLVHDVGESRQVQLEVLVKCYRPINNLGGIASVRCTNSVGW